jgi:DNA-binding NarL/FixJ family response regulator
VRQRKRLPLAKSPAASLRVALLEPQALVRDLLVFRLRGAGMQVVASEGEPEALQAALERAPADVVLLCVRAAPGTLELIYALAQRHPGLRQVVSTPDPEPLFLERAHAAGAALVLCRRLQGSADLLRALRGAAQRPAGAFVPRLPAAAAPSEQLPEH